MGLSKSCRQQTLQKPILYPYQQEWINDKSRLKIGRWSRQIGKTFTSTLDIVLDALEAEAQGKTSSWVIGSRSQRQAKIAMDDGVKYHLKKMGAIFKDYEYELETKETALEVIFPNGSIVTAVPASPDTIVGFPDRNIYLDEFALHKDSRAIWAAVAPIITSRPDLRMIVTSTPRGKGNLFYQFMTDETDFWSKHTVDIYKAIEDGAPRDLDFIKKLVDDAEIFAQEYEVKWLDASYSWLDWDMILNVEDDQAGNPNHYQGGPVFIGNDIARHKDLWVAYVFEQVGDVLWEREMIAKRNITFAAQDAIMDDLFNRYRVIKLAMDKTGMGEKPVEDAEKRYGKTRVEGVNFSATSKLNMANIALNKFQDRKVRIQAGNSLLRTDLHSIKKVTTDERIYLKADRNSDSHADRAWACFLALHAAQSDYQPYKSHQVNRHMQGQRRMATTAGFGKHKGAI